MLRLAKSTRRSASSFTTTPSSFVLLQRLASFSTKVDRHGLLVVRKVTDGYSDVTSEYLDADDYLTEAQKTKEFLRWCENEYVDFAPSVRIAFFDDSPDTTSPPSATRRPLAYLRRGLVAVRTIQSGTPYLHTPLSAIIAAPRVPLWPLPYKAPGPSLNPNIDSHDNNNSTTPSTFIPAVHSAIDEALQATHSALFQPSSSSTNTPSTNSPTPHPEPKPGSPAALLRAIAAEQRSRNPHVSSHHVTTSGWTNSTNDGTSPLETNDVSQKENIGNPSSTPTPATSQPQLSTASSPSSNPTSSDQPESLLASLLHPPSTVPPMIEASHGSAFRLASLLHAITPPSTTSSTSQSQAKSASVTPLSPISNKEEEIAFYRRRTRDFSPYLSMLSSRPLAAWGLSHLTDVLSTPHTKWDSVASKAINEHAKRLTNTSSSSTTTTPPTSPSSTSPNDKDKSTFTNTSATNTTEKDSLSSEPEILITPSSSLPHASYVWSPPSSLSGASSIVGTAVRLSQQSGSGVVYLSSTVPSTSDGFHQPSLQHTHQMKVHQLQNRRKHEDQRETTSSSTSTSSTTFTPTTTSGAKLSLIDSIAQALLSPPPSSSSSSSTHSPLSPPLPSGIDILSQQVATVYNRGLALHQELLPYIHLLPTPISILRGTSMYSSTPSPSTSPSPSLSPLPESINLNCISEHIHRSIDVDPSVVLVPGIDMLNHSSTSHECNTAITVGRGDPHEYDHDIANAVLPPLTKDERDISLKLQSKTEEAKKRLKGTKSTSTENTTPSNAAMDTNTMEDSTIPISEKRLWDGLTPLQVAVTAVTTRTVSPGEELRINYGDLRWGLRAMEAREAAIEKGLSKEEGERQAQSVTTPFEVLPTAKTLGMYGFATKDNPTDEFSVNLSDVARILHGLHIDVSHTQPSSSSTPSSSTTPDSTSTTPTRLPLPPSLAESIISSLHHPALAQKVAPVTLTPLPPRILSVVKDIKTCLTISPIDLLNALPQDTLALVSMAEAYANTARNEAGLSTLPSIFLPSSSTSTTSSSPVPPPPSSASSKSATNDNQVRLRHRGDVLSLALRLLLEAATATWRTPALLDLLSGVNTLASSSHTTVTNKNTINDTLEKGSSTTVSIEDVETVLSKGAWSSRLLLSDVPRPDQFHRALEIEDEQEYTSEEKYIQGLEEGRNKEAVDERKIMSVDEIVDQMIRQAAEKVVITQMSQEKAHVKGTPISDTITMSSPSDKTNSAEGNMGDGHGIESLEIPLSPTSLNIDKSSPEFQQRVQEAVYKLAQCKGGMGALLTVVSNAKRVLLHHYTALYAVKASETARVAQDLSKATMSK